MRGGLRNSEELQVAPEECACHVGLGRPPMFPPPAMPAAPEGVLRLQRVRVLMPNASAAPRQVPADAAPSAQAVPATGSSAPGSRRRSDRLSVDGSPSPLLPLLPLAVRPVSAVGLALDGPVDPASLSTPGPEDPGRRLSPTVESPAHRFGASPPRHGGLSLGPPGGTPVSPRPSLVGKPVAGATPPLHGLLADATGVGRAAIAR